MQLTFRGAARQVYVHNHPCNSVRWKSGPEATGTIRGVGLSGDCRVAIGFEEQDVQIWAEALIKSNPDLALRISNKMRAEAIIRLTARPDGDTTSK